LRLARRREHAAWRECPYSYHAIGHIPEGKSMHSTSKSVFPFANATEEYGCPKRERPTSQGVSATMTMAAPTSWTRNSQPACAWDTIPERGFSAADASQRIALQLAGDWDPSANLGTFATIS